MTLARSITRGHPDFHDGILLGAAFLCGLLGSDDGPNLTGLRRQWVPSKELILPSQLRYGK